MDTDARTTPDPAAFVDTAPVARATAALSRVCFAATGTVLDDAHARLLTEAMLVAFAHGGGLDAPSVDHLRARAEHLAAFSSQLGSPDRGPVSVLQIEYGARGYFEPPSAEPADAFDHLADRTFPIGGAMHLAGRYLGGIGVQLGDERIRSLAARTLCGFAMAGGLAPESVEALRSAAVALDAREGHGAPGMGAAGPRPIVDLHIAGTGPEA